MNLDITFNIVTAGLCLFCSHLLMLRRQDTGVYLPLSLLFLFQGISSSFAALAEIYDPDRMGLMFRISVVVGGLEIVIPFLFWVYVRALTTEGQTERIPKLWRHLIPIVVVLAAFWSLLLLPSGLEQTELSEDDPRALGFLMIAFAVLVGNVVFIGMVAAYIYLIIRRLMAYRTRLKDVFASTENRELTWIWGILACMAFYLCVNVALIVSVIAGVFTQDSYDELLPSLNGVAVLVVFWAIGVWGLRQRPGMTRQPVASPPQPELPPVRKYEKSALDDDRLQRIASKIETAMSKDLLYRDPNLSLWDLATHIGVSGHYVSQALNSTLNKSFFDVVNGWRIKDAVQQLNTTEETILMIAYDVGFNSRSAFYKAFKRETGKTPSDLRK